MIGQKKRSGEQVGPGINFPEIHIAPSSINVIVGTVIGGGTVADIQEWQDGNILQIQEEAATPGQNIEVTFENVRSFRRIGIAMAYMGSATHWVELAIWDTVSETWKVIHTFPNALGQNYRYTDIPPNSHDFIDASGNVKIRFYHPVAGNASHNSYMDYVGLII